MDDGNSSDEEFQEEGIIDNSNEDLAVFYSNYEEMKKKLENTKLNERFRSSETVEKASLEETKYNFLYEDENNYFFIVYYSQISNEAA